MSDRDVGVSVPDTTRRLSDEELAELDAAAKDAIEKWERAKTLDQQIAYAMRFGDREFQRLSSAEVVRLLVAELQERRQSDD